MLSNSFVAGLFSWHPYSKGRMLSWAGSEDQGACSEWAGSVALLSWASWKQSHTLQGTALDAPWALLVCCEIACAVTALQSVPQWSVCYGFWYGSTAWPRTCV